jgi:hypothetical protein
MDGSTARRWRRHCGRAFLRGCPERQIPDIRPMSPHTRRTVIVHLAPWLATPLAYSRTGLSSSSLTTTSRWTSRLPWSCTGALRVKLQRSSSFDLPSFLLRLHGRSCERFEPSEKQAEGLKPAAASPQQARRLPLCIAAVLAATARMQDGRQHEATPGDRWHAQGLRRAHGHEPMSFARVSIAWISPIPAPSSCALSGPA